MNSRSAFTLIELLVVISITVALSTIGVLSLARFRAHQSLDLAGQGLVAFLRDAQQKSIGQENLEEWGVRFFRLADGRDYYAVIHGDSVAGYSEGERVTLPAAVEFAGDYPDLIFQKSSGLPPAPLTLIIRLSSDPDAFREITVNEQGTISN